MSTPVTEQSQTLPAEKPTVFGDRLFTAAELMVLSAGVPCRYELRQGKLIVKPFADAANGQLTLDIGTHMHRFVDDHSSGIVFAAGTGFQLETDPDTVLAPDVGFVAQHRL